MSTQPEALRLADWLDGSSNGPMDARHKAAAELRRLHEANQELLEVLKNIAGQSMSMYGSYSYMIEKLQDTARAAIAKAEGQP